MYSSFGTSSSSFGSSTFGSSSSFNSLPMFNSSSSFGSSSYSTPSLSSGYTSSYGTYGNGSTTSIPNDIWSPHVPNGTYGVQTTCLGAVGNSNTTPQVSGWRVIKGDGYVRSENTQTGQFTVVSENGLRTSGYTPTFSM